MNAARPRLMPLVRWAPRLEFYWCGGTGWWVRLITSAKQELEVTLRHVLCLVLEGCGSCDIELADVDADTLKRLRTEGVRHVIPKCLASSDSTLRRCPSSFFTLVREAILFVLATRVLVQHLSCSTMGRHFSRFILKLSSLSFFCAAASRCFCSLAE